MGKKKSAASSSPEEERLSIDPTSYTVSNIQKIGVAALSLLVLYLTDLASILLSERINRSFLFLALALFGIFGCIWVYTATYLSKRNVKWFEENERLLYFATVVALLGGVAFIAAIWPVYYFFSIPVWVVVVMLVTNLSGISFKGPKPVSKMM